jgi:hypothetical protein
VDILAGVALVAAVAVWLWEEEEEGWLWELLLEVKKATSAASCRVECAGGALRWIVWPRTSAFAASWLKRTSLGRGECLTPRKAG